jgi:hypothetical protein
LCGITFNPGIFTFHLLCVNKNFALENFDGELDMEVFDPREDDAPGRHEPRERMARARSTVRLPLRTFDCDPCPNLSAVRAKEGKGKRREDVSVIDLRPDGASSIIFPLDEEGCGRH